MSVQRTLWSAVAAALLAACGKGDPCGSLTEPLLVAAVEVLPSQVALRVGQTAQLRATPLSRCNRPVALAQVTYTTSDPAVLTVTPTGMVTALGPGTAEVRVSSEGRATSVAVTITIVPVVSIAVSPSPLTLGLGHSLPLEATLFDSAGNELVGRPVTWTSSNPAVASVDANGVVTGMRLGGPVDVTAESGLAVGTTAVEVIRPAPQRVQFNVQPSDAIAGDPLTPAIVVAVQDSLGLVIPGDTTPVSIALGTNSNGAVLLGTTTVTAIDGMATFTDLEIEQAGAGYTLIASASTLAADTSVGFTVAPGPPAGLRYGQQPSDVIAGDVIVPPVEIEVVDSFGNRVTSSTALIDLAIGTNPGGATLSGMTSVAAVQGVAVFPDLSLDKAGVGYTLDASTGGRPPATSTAFTVRPGPAVALVFQVQPTDTDHDKRIRPAVEVAAVDAHGNVTPNPPRLVSMSIAVNPGGSVLSGTPVTVTLGGIAVFPNLILDQKGTGYVLAADSPGLTQSLSAPFDIK